MQMIHSATIGRRLTKPVAALLFALWSLFFLSCNDALTIDPQDDYIVFGHFDAYCYGGIESCVDFYKLTEDFLLESNVDQYAENGFYPFDDFYALSQDKFDLVKDLGEFVPQELWLETATHIGQPEISDVGSLYFEIKNGTEHRYWVFEVGDLDMPEVYRVFMAKIEEKHSLLKF
jgi:hypothetical protein